MFGWFKLLPRGLLLISVFDCQNMTQESEINVVNNLSKITIHPSWGHKTLQLFAKCIIVVKYNVVFAIPCRSKKVR